MPRRKSATKGAKNIEHCLRVSHAAGGSGVLIVVGRGDDGPEEEIDERGPQGNQEALPLAASLGQPILFENVWNKMHYDHDAPPEQSPERFIEFVDSFNSPWVGMYYDIGNHWKYGQPREWLKAFGRRAVKLDVKGFSRAKNKFVDITSEDDDLPWDEVQKGLDDIGFTGWTTAEVGGGGLERLTTVRKQMQKAFGSAVAVATDLWSVREISFEAISAGQTRGPPPRIRLFRGAVFDEIDRAERPDADECFSRGKAARGAGDQRRPFDAVEDVGLRGRELRLVAGDRGQLLVQRVR